MSITLGLILSYVGAFAPALALFIWGLVRLAD